MASKEEAIFCKIAVKNKLLTVEQCKECERIRTEEGEKKSLVQMFVEKGYISNKMADAIFRAEERIKKRIEKQKPKPTAKKEKSEEEYTYELLDSETAYQLTPAEAGDTVHPDIIKNGDTDTALPPKIIGKDTFYENLTEEQRREIEGLNLPAGITKSDSAVYNINVQQFGEKGKNLPATVDSSSITLHRGELTESQLLALIKGERITLPTPAAQAPAPVQHLMTGQHTIMAAMQKNTLLTMLAIGVLVIMFGMGMFALMHYLNRSPIVQPKNLPGMSFTEVTAMLGSNSHFVRKQAIDELARRAREGEGSDKERYQAVEALVFHGLHDQDSMVREAARLGLLELARKPENSGLVNSANVVLLQAYSMDTATPELKIIYIRLLDSLNYDRIVEEVLKEAVKDEDPRVRIEAMTHLVTKESLEALNTAAMALTDEDSEIVKTALDYLWEKREKFPMADNFRKLLEDPENAVVLSRVVNFLIDKKVEKYQEIYAGLVQTHPDVGIKIASVKALEAFGPAVDGIIYTPFDTALSALPDNAEFRNAVLEACKVIRGENSDDILGKKIMVGDSDPNRKKAAREFLVKYGTPKGKDFVIAYDKDLRNALVAAMVKDIQNALALSNAKKWAEASAAFDKILKDTDTKLVDDAFREINLTREAFVQKHYEIAVGAKAGEITAALSLGVAKKWESAFPALDKIRKDANAKLIDEALKKLGHTREKFEKMYVDFRIEAKHIQQPNGEWFDPWPEWNKTLVEVKKKEDAKQYTDAVIELSKFNSYVLEKSPDIKKAFEEKEKQLDDTALAAVQEDKAIVRDKIAKEDFPGGTTHINLMKQRYRRDAFSWAELQIGYVEQEWRNAEAIFRGKVFVIESGMTLEEARQIVRNNISGKDIRDFGTYAITRGAGGIVIDFKLNARQTYSLPLSFNLHGARKVKKDGALELKALQLRISGPRGTEVRVNMTGGSGTSYSAVKTSISGETAFSFATDFQASGGVMNKASDETQINALTITITVHNRSTERRTQTVTLNNVAFVK